MARRWLHEEPRLNDMLSAFLQYFGVIYGLLLGLLAVATWQDRSEVEKGIANEASSLAALYRDVSSYPEPDRTELQNLIRGHTRYIIDQVWPLQREGTPPVYERKRVEVIQARRFSIAERDSMLTPTRCPGAVKLDRRYLLPRGLTVVSKNRRVA